MVELGRTVRQVNTADARVTARGDIQVTVPNAQGVFRWTVQPIESHQNKVGGWFQFAVITAEGRVEREVMLREDIAHRRAVVVRDNGRFQVALLDFGVKFVEAFVQLDVVRGAPLRFQEDGFGAFPRSLRQAPDVVHYGAIGSGADFLPKLFPVDDGPRNGAVHVEDDRFYY